MKAAIMGAARQLNIQDIPAPQPDGKKVIIKVTHCGICGSDLGMWTHGTRKGQVLGHEFSGVVYDPGCMADKLQVGDRVTYIPGEPCGDCYVCRIGHSNLCMTNSFLADPSKPNLNGAYSEYFIAKRPDYVRKLPDNVSFKEGAMAEPLAVALRAIHRSGIRLGDKVLVNGAGFIGQLCIALAKKAGASYVAVAEVNENRGRAALKFGDADAFFDTKKPDAVEQMKKAVGGLFDVVIDCTGVGPAIATGMQVLRPVGHFLFVGTNPRPIDFSFMTPFIMKEIIATGVLGYTAEEFDTALDMMDKKLIDTEKYITGELPLAQLQAAFETLTDPTKEDVKIIIHIPE